MATDILEIFKRSIGKNQRYLLDPSQHLQFCTGVHPLSCELHLSYKATSRPFRRRFGKWHHKTETVGEFLEGKIFWVWLRCTVIKHTCTFINVLQERQDCFWSAFWFIQLPGIMDVGFWFCFSWDFLHATFRAVQPCIEVGVWDKLGATTPGKSCENHWNYGLQHKNFKICLLMLIWTCSVLNPKTGSV